MTSTSDDYYIGIDVGTGSVRASLVRKDGAVAASATQEIKTWRDPSDHRIFEQSSADIWTSTAAVIKACLFTSGVSATCVKGLGFDATCSLAVTNFNGDPVVVTKGASIGSPGERNVILWADHRAEKETVLINKTRSIVLDYVGGTMSLEMEIPKILWLKNNMDPDKFSRCQFFDLPDWLTYQATKDDTRSVCSLTCKCSYVPASGWQEDFFRQIGLQELYEREYAQIGAKTTREVLVAGMPVGKGLSKSAAEELGLVEGTAVGSALIDAYAGWLGTVAARYIENGKLAETLPSIEESRHRLAAVAGTSTCHIVQSPEGIFVDGIWGPYKDPIISGWWMNEGGQSSTGQLIEYTLTTHPAYEEVKGLASARNTSVHSVLEETLERLRSEAGVDSRTELCKDLHIYPDFHGNRSPIADPRMRGSIVGLELDSGINDLTKRYHATLEAIALQNRHIIDTLNNKGHQITSIFMSGGQAKNITLMQLFADVCGIPVVLPKDSGGAVVLGAAMLGRLAADGGNFGKEQQGQKLWDIMVAMTPPGTEIVPKADPKTRRLLEAKYKIFLEAIDLQKRWRNLMEEAAA